MSAAAAPLLTALKPYLGGISNNFTNMVRHFIVLWKRF